MMKLSAFLILSFLLISLISKNKFLEHPNYPIIERHKNGQLKTIGCMQNASPTGTWITFFQNGKIESIEHYSPLYDEQWTYLIGTAFEYHSNGRIKRRTEYFNPDEPDSSFNYVGKYPGVTDGFDIILRNGEVFCGEKWDSLGKQLVKTRPVIRKNGMFILPVEYIITDMYVMDTLFYKANSYGWLDLLSKKN